jgi:hypothetical protein
MKKKAWVSRIDFRPDPADPKKDVVNLGFLLEFTGSDYWAISVVMLAAIDDSALAGLDDLSKKLIETRKEVIEHEVRRVLPQARRPGEVLPLLSLANPWSIHVGTPAALDVSGVRAPSGASAETIAEQYARSLFVRAHPLGKQKAGKQKPAALKSAKQNLARVILPRDYPPPWILQPSCIIRRLES